jgi:hypothetical protein
MPAAIVSGMDTEDPKPEAQEEDRIAIPLDPEDALNAILQVDPVAEPVEQDPEPPQGDPLSR